MAACLALWSLGMIVARSCSLTAVAWAWVPILKEKFYTLRERLRDLYREAPAKAGDHRRELDLGTCWAPWLSWVVDGWHSKQLALALDATTLGQRFTVLAVSVLYRGCAVPVAWKILKSTEPHAWEPEWKILLSHFRQRVPADWTVIVLADRGLYAKWLFEAITALHWHPLLRVKNQGKFRPQGWYHWVDMPDLVAHVGQRWQGRGTAFKTASAQLDCTLLACWGEGYADPSLLAHAVVVHQDSDATPLQLENDALQLQHLNRVDTAERLVQQQKAGIDDQRAGELHPGPLPPREDLARWE